MIDDSKETDRVTIDELKSENDELYKNTIKLEVTNLVISEIMKTLTHEIENEDED